MKSHITHLLLLTRAALTATLPQAHHSPLVDTIFSLPASPSWFENLAYRPSTDTILATRLDLPQIWSIDPATGDGALLTNVTETLGVVGISQLTYTAPETFIFASVNFSTTAGLQANSSVLWSLTFEDNGSAAVEKVVSIPQMGLINGVTRWDDHTILTTDSSMGTIWKVDVTTGEATIVLQDPTMELTDSAGVNGVHVYRPRGSDETYVYFTSTDQGLLARVPVSPTTAQRCPSNASVEIIASGLAPDDFALLPDGSVFLANGENNTVVHVGLDGTVKTVAGSQGSLVLASGTACALGVDKKVYVTTAGGQKAPVNGTLTGPGTVVEIDFAAISRW